MREYKFLVTLTNGQVESKYNKWASCEKYAVILAQAEAINMGRGIDLVNVRKLY